MRMKERIERVEQNRGTPPTNVRYVGKLTF